MLQKKICLLGAFGVGKTSLVRRFVDTIFSDNYLTTVGVKLDKKTLEVAGETVNLILWDIAGEDAVSAVRTTYLRGSAGYVLVADGTRADTLDVARSIQVRAETEIGRVPFLLLVNKADLRAEWTIPEGVFAELAGLGWTVHYTSAKTGESVEAAFQELSERVAR
jgi:small GTP-binding protein